MAVEKSSTSVLTFTGTDCSAKVTDQFVLRVTVPAGEQTVNFPVIQLPEVAALFAMAAADADVAALIVANTPPPEEPVVP